MLGPNGWEAHLKKKLFGRYVQGVGRIPLGSIAVTVPSSFLRNKHDFFLLCASKNFNGYKSKPKTKTPCITSSPKISFKSNHKSPWPQKIDFHHKKNRSNLMAKNRSTQNENSLHNSLTKQMTVHEIEINVHPKQW